MPLIFAPIAAFLAMIVSSLVARVLFALGLGIMIYTSIDSGLGYLEAQISGSMSGIGSDMLAILRMAGFAEFMSIVFSAWSAVMAIKLVTGVFKKLTFVPTST